MSANSNIIINRKLIPEQLILETATELMTRAAIDIPPDYRKALKEAASKETESMSCFVIKTMLENYEVAEQDRRPMCADTGLPRFYVKSGNEAQVEGGFVALERAIRKAVVSGTNSIPLRPNRVHPLTRKDNNNNVGIHAPEIQYAFEPGDDWIDLITVHKGGLFGTDYRMLFPGDGIDGYAVEYAVRSATAFTHAPRGWSHAEAATITTAGLTAWRALAVNGQLKAGDSVLVLGTGGVSIAALQIAKSMGARVIATTGSDKKFEQLHELGADHIINYRQTPDWGQHVLELTGGHGVDHIVEVGGAGTLTQSIRAVKVGGHIALIGVLTGFSGEVPTMELMSKQVRLQGLIVGNRRQQQEYIAALEQSGIRPIIHSSLPLEQLADAFRLQERGEHFGKLVVEW